MNSFLELNAAKAIVVNDKIIINALPQTDFFVNPENGQVTANAQYIYKLKKGDFVMQAKVSHDFVSIYDACVLFAFDNDKKWAKACFELTDFGTKAVVTVMTNEKSDDANGVNIEKNEVWLRLSRKDDVFAVHYSLDGKNFIMARLCSIPMSEEIKVGMVAQSPLGTGGNMVFEHFSLESKSLTDIRKGE